MKSSTTNNYLLLALGFLLVTIVNQGVAYAQPIVRDHRCTVRLLSPQNNAVVDQRRIEGGKVASSWSFSWTGCPTATRYHLYVIGPRATNPIVNIDTLASTSYLHTSTHYGIRDVEGWKWYVRAYKDGTWRRWSEKGIFNVRPVEVAPVTAGACSIAGTISGDRREYQTKVGLYSESGRLVFPRISVDNRGHYRFSSIPVGSYRVVPNGKYPGGKLDIGPSPRFRRVQCQPNGTHSAHFTIGSNEG